MTCRGTGNADQVQNVEGALVKGSWVRGANFLPYFSIGAGQQACRGLRNRPGFRICNQVRKATCRSCLNVDAGAHPVTRQQTGSKCTQEALGTGPACRRLGLHVTGGVGAVEDTESQISCRRGPACTGRKLMLCHCETLKGCWHSEPNWASISLVIERYLSAWSSLPHSRLSSSLMQRNRGRVQLADTHRAPMRCPEEQVRAAPA